jgi:zinc transport system substrate-binding protein
VSIAGIDPEAEPSPARVAEVADFAAEHGVTTIFFETLLSPAIAETIADEIGVTTDVLDPIEGTPEDTDYFGAMHANLSALQTALGCS